MTYGDSMVNEPFQSPDPLNPYKDPPGIKSRVLVTGLFEIFHAGHVHFLSEAHKYHVGEYKEMVVGIPDDESFHRLNNCHPIFPFDDRKAVVESSKYVRRVVKFPLWIDEEPGKGKEDGFGYLLDIVKPILVVDSSRTPQWRIGYMPHLRKRNIPIEYVDSIDLYATNIFNRGGHHGN